MCKTKDEAKSKLDKITASMDRLADVLERVLVTDRPACLASLETPPQAPLSPCR